MKVNKKTTIFLWILSLIMTLTIAVYQRLTGPTHPAKGTETVGEAVVNYRLLRSFTEFQHVPVAISAPDRQVTAQLLFRRYKADDPWTAADTEKSQKHQPEVSERHRRLCHGGDHAVGREIVAVA